MVSSLYSLRKRKKLKRKSKAHNVKQSEEQVTDLGVTICSISYESVLYMHTGYIISFL